MRRPSEAARRGGNVPYAVVAVELATPAASVNIAAASALECSPQVQQQRSRQQLLGKVHPLHLPCTPSASPLHPLSTTLRPLHTRCTLVCLRTRMMASQR
jgi:hypothetical protein